MSDEKIDVVAVLNAFAWNSGSATRDDAASASDAVVELIRLAANAERIIRNCVNAGQLPEGYMHHADGLRDALARVRSS